MTGNAVFMRTPGLFMFSVHQKCTKSDDYLVQLVIIEKEENVTGFQMIETKAGFSW
jgi:hypothetical protein